MGLKWLRGVIAYYIVIWWPGSLEKVHWLLPWAGDYAYWNDPWVRWCREANYRVLDLDRAEPF